MTAEEEVAEAVFQQVFIPKKLDEVAHYERDHARLQQGGEDTEGIYYQAIAGMKADMSGARLVPAVLEMAAGGDGAAGKRICEPAVAGGSGWVAQAAAPSEAVLQQQRKQEQQLHHHRDAAAAGSNAAGSDAAVEMPAAPAAEASSRGAPAEQHEAAAELGSSSDDDRSPRQALPSEGGSTSRAGRRVTFAAGTEGGSADSDSGSEAGGSGSGSGSGSGDDEGESWEDRPKLSKDEMRAARKEHKKEVKSVNKERRLEKMPKHVKKRAAKAGKKKR